MGKDRHQSSTSPPIINAESTLIFGGVPAGNYRKQFCLLTHILFSIPEIFTPTLPYFFLLKFLSPVKKGGGSNYDVQTDIAQHFSKSLTHICITNNHWVSVKLTHHMQFQATYDQGKYNCDTQHVKVGN